MKKILSFIALLFVTGIAQAQVTTSGLMGLGCFSGECANYLVSNMSTLTGNQTFTGDIINSTASKGLVMGEASRAANVTTATTLAVPLYLSKAASGTDLAAFVGTGASASGPTLDFFKTRATSGAATTIAVSADVAGQIKFFGANGTTYDPAAAIVVKIDGTPGASADMPGSIDLQVSPDGSATLASGLKLTNDKKVTLGGNLAFSATSAKIIPGATSLLFRDNGDANSNLSIVDAGDATFRATVTSTGLFFPTANEEAVAGAGTTVSDAAALSATKHVHQITGANGTVGWKFASATAGQLEFLLSTTSGVPKVYAVAGGTCNGGATDAACTLLSGIVVHVCYATAASTWICA